MNKFPFGVKSKVDVPLSVKKDGANATFGTRGFYGAYFDQLLFDLQCDHMWGTAAQVAIDSATFYTNASGTPLDKTASPVTINEDDKILIVHDVSLTANTKLVCGGVAVTLEMIDTNTMDMATYTLTLGSTGDMFRGDIRLSGTNTLTIEESAGLRVTHDSMSINNLAGDIVVNNVRSDQVTDLAIGNINSELVNLDLQNSINLIKGSGEATFTGPSGRKYTDFYGVVQTAGLNVPRFEKEGLLLEGQSENVALFSETFTNGVWVQTNVTPTENTTLAPDGNLTADTLTADANNGVCQQVITGTSGVDYTSSFWVKRLSGSGNIFMRSAILTTTLIPVNDEWQRFVLTNESDSTAIRIGIQFQTSGDSVAIWGGQLERLSFASSYIPTASAPVLRTTEALSLPYSGNFPGTLVNKTIIARISTLGTSLTISDLLSSGDTRMVLNSNTVNDGLTSVSMGVGAATPSVFKTGSFSYGTTYNKSTTTLTMYHDGVSVSQNTTATVATTPLSTINIGEIGSFFHIESLKIWNTTLTASEMRIGA